MLKGQVETKSLQRTIFYWQTCCGAITKQQYTLQSKHQIYNIKHKLCIPLPPQMKYFIWRYFFSKYQRFEAAQFYAGGWAFKLLEPQRHLHCWTEFRILSYISESSDQAASTMITIRSTIPKITRSKQVCRKYIVSGNHLQTQNNSVQGIRWKYNMKCTKVGGKQNHQFEFANKEWELLD